MIRCESRIHIIKVQAVIPLIKYNYTVQVYLQLFGLLDLQTWEKHFNSVPHNHCGIIVKDSRARDKKHFSHGVYIERSLWPISMLDFSFCDIAVILSYAIEIFLGITVCYRNFSRPCDVYNHQINFLYFTYEKFFYCEVGNSCNIFKTPIYV